MSEKFEVKDGLKIPSGKQLELNNVTLSGISNDTSLSASSSSDLVTEFAVKSYVDANNQWTLSDGTSSTVVDTGNTLSISGTNNEVNVMVDQDADGFQIGLPASVEIETKLTTAELSATGTVTLADGASLATSAAPTADAGIANKKYVDDQLGSTAMSAATDTGNMNPIDLDSEVLTLTGGEGMNVTHSGNTITFAGELATETNAGVATFDGTDFTVTSGDVTVNAERVQDIIGGMLGGASVQNGISVSYDDDNGELDFDVADPTITISGDVSGSATMNNLGDVTINVAQQDNSVDLTTHTTGNYVATIAGGTGLTSTGALTGEGIAHSLSVDANQDGNLSSANSLVTVGALDAGSITSGFGNVDIGDSTLAAGATTIAGALSASGRLTVGTVADATSMASTAAPTDDAHIANKKYVDDQLGSTAMSAATDSGNMNPIDLDSEVLTLTGGEGMNVTHSGNTVTFAGEDASATNKGVASFDSTDFTVTSGDVTVNAERVQDIIGGMVAGASVQSGISVSYDDDNGELDFNVADPTITLSGDLSGAATMNNLGDVTISATILENSVALATDTTGDYVADLTAGTGITSTGAVSGENISHTLSVDANQDGNISSANSLVTVGALDAGSITSGFGNIDTGTSTLAAGNTTITGTISASGRLTVGSIADATSMATTAAPTDDAHIANKKYVDDQLGASALSATIGNTTHEIDLDSESISFSGTASEVDVSSAADGSGNVTVTYGLPSDVTIANNLDVTADLTCATITNNEFTVAANGNTDIDGTLNVEGIPTFQAQSVHSSGIDCNGQLSMEGNDIVGTASNMLLQADDEDAYTFGGTDQLALQASSGIVFVDEIASNVIPTGTRTLGDSNNHWNITYTNRVDLQNARLHSFTSTPASNDASAVMTFAHSEFKSAKVSLNVKSGNNYTAREVIIVCDENGANAKLVEYGILSTSSELGTLSVATNGANIELRVENANDMPCTGVVSFIE